MADITATDLASAVAELKDLATSGAGLNELADYVGKVTTKLGLTSTAAETLQGELTKVKNLSLDLAKVNLSDAIEGWSNHLDSLGHKLQEIIPGIVDLSSTVALASPQFLARTTVPRSFMEIGESARDASADINESVEAISKITGLNSKWIEALAASAEAGKRMELGLVSMAGSSGQLSRMLGETGDLISNLPGQAESWSAMSQRIANDTGTLSPVVSRLAAQLGSAMPDALSDIDRPGIIAGQRITNLEAAMQTAMGTGQSYDVVVKDLVDLFETMGIKGAPALEFIARMERASESVGIPLKFVKQYAQDAASSFALYADDTKAASETTQGAINIISRLGPALQQSGLGPKAITDLVKGVTDGIARMDTAQKAFLSAQTGGPGGLQGAFQIDQMLAEGKIDQVFDRVRQNMMQKLGPIVTRAEAAASPEAAGQFQKQIMFMMSPAMGGIAKDQASAVKLLEAMASGKNELPAGMEDKDRILRETMERGSRLQERGNSKLTEIANYTKRLAELGAISNAGVLRQTLGAESTQFSREQMERRGQAAVPATVAPFSSRQGRSISEVVNTIDYKKEAEKAIGSVGGYTFGLLETIKNKATNQRDLLPGISSEELQKSFRPSLSAPPSGTISVRSLLEKQKPELNRVSSQVPTTNVTVNTMCSMCQRKIAREETTKLLTHHHEQEVRQNFLGTPNP